MFKVFENVKFSSLLSFFGHLSAIILKLATSAKKIGLGKMTSKKHKNEKISKKNLKTTSNFKNISVKIADKLIILR